ncbi:MAG: hypothetical protein Q8R37_00930 [Nanoarchaeota archaeon]|nr:hypothetical protein [Nanoarchaeota archaeon]
MVIRKIPHKQVWTLKSKKTGKLLGKFRSKKAAMKRERQIQFFKRMKR